MKKLLLEILITGSKLCLICALSAFVLGLINSVTWPHILLNREKQEKLALAELISRGVPDKKKKATDDIVVSYYEVRAGEELVSYVLELIGPGYGGPIKILAHYLPDGELLGAKLMDNKETPGLGKKAENPGYMNKFIGKGGIGQISIPTTPGELSPGELFAEDISPKEVSPVEILPGDGENIVEWFFGKPGTGSQDSITGATITFSGISKALAGGSTYVKTHLGGEY